MGLVHNSLDSLFGGVNQQSAEHRLPTQVEEMVNAYPTINQGLLKRNPTVRKELSAQLNFTSDVWTYEYDRGFAGEGSEKYAINITNDGMEIINTVDGTVYKDGAGLTYEGVANEYIFPFVGANGYAATTIKDTTFLVNKNRTPVLFNTKHGGDVTPVEKTYHYSVTPIVKSPPKFLTNSSFVHYPVIYEFLKQNLYAPTKMLLWYDYDITSDFTDNRRLTMFGSTTTVIIDGVVIKMVTPQKKVSFHNNLRSRAIALIAEQEIMSYITYIATLEESIRSALDPNLYHVERAVGYGDPTSSFPPLRITRWDESAIVLSFTIDFNPITIPVYPDLHFGEYVEIDRMESVEADYLGSEVLGTYVTTFTPPISDFQKDGFIWIKRSDPVDTGYTYSYSVSDSLDNVKAGEVSNTTTDGAAEDIATAIDLDANFSAFAIGSVVRVTALNGDMKRVDAGDSYGNQASFGWAREVTHANDLPKNLGFTGSLVKVVGTSANSFSAYWLVYTDGQWRETVDPASKTTINPTSMPHTLIRNADNTFTLKAYDQWIDKAVGDDETNKPVSFLATTEDPSPVIKDIFFFKNRIGFITSRTVVMSEVGKYGNFWRTTVATVLDSDPIDATVDTTKAIELEYATYLEDSVMLFSDIQFRLSGGDVLTPKNVQISQTSAYEINRNVRPVFMNDRIFFCTKRGSHTAVLEYFVSETASAKSEANDITAHCQTYIPQDIIKLSGSPINNMLFLISPSTPDTIYVYKYYDAGRERVQSAWFKWTFNGTVLNAFSFGKFLNIMIERKEAIAVEDWVVGSGIWEGDKLWRGDLTWIGDPNDLVVTNQFEQMQIAPMDYLETEFIDDSRNDEDKSVVNSYSIDGTYASGELLTREDFNVLLTTDVTFTLTHVHTTGSVMYTVHDTVGNSYSSVAVDGEPTVIVVPAIVAESVNKITITPLYNSPVTMSINPPIATSAESEDNLILHLDTYGWYVDGVSISADPNIDNQGAWFKNYGVSNVGSLIPTTVNVGEWVLDRGGKKEVRGTLKFKTAQVSSEDGSDFSLVVTDVKRDSKRGIPAKYTVNRKPMIYGDAKNVRIGIISNSEVGFKINSVSYEGNFNIRSKRT